MSYYSRRTRETQAAPPAAVSKKVPIEKSQQLLKSLLREPHNRVCADCKTATHPRWASWNLGCFICIRCSGIHRGLGTHISRVKSVDLDAWTEEQLESMMKWGNARCNQYWEAKLPKGHVPDDNKIENFIRTKYDMKKWAASSSVPDPDTLGTPTTTAAPAPAPAQAPAPAKPAQRTNEFAGIPQIATKAPATTQQSSLIGLDFDEPPHAQPVQAQPAQAVTPAQPTQTIQNDLFSLSQPPQTQSQPAQQQPFPSASAPDTSRPDLKKSILSLYANSRPAPAVQQQQQPQTQPSGGFGFGNAPLTSNAGFGTIPQATNSGFQQTNNGFGGFGQNDWTSAAAPKKQEDDVFANVWK